MSNMGSITISQKYGLNPSIAHCECCGKEIGIALFGTGYKDKEGKTAKAPMNVSMGLCDDCNNVIKAEGLMIIEVRDGETGNSPYRTGRIVGITKECKEKAFKDINSPIAYMEETTFSKLFNDLIKK